QRAMDRCVSAGDPFKRLWPPRQRHRIPLAGKRVPEPVRRLPCVCYFTRFQVTSALAPNDVAGLVYFSSSAVTAPLIRFWPHPTRFGNPLPSPRVINILSASLTVYVPNRAMNPASTALF